MNVLGLPIATFVLDVLLLPAVQFSVQFKMNVTPESVFLLVFILLSYINVTAIQDATH